MDTIVVNKPANLVVSQDTFTGNETDPTQPVYLDWRTTGNPWLQTVMP